MLKTEALSMFCLPDAPPTFYLRAITLHCYFTAIHTNGVAKRYILGVRCRRELVLKEKCSFVVKDVSRGKYLHRLPAKLLQCCITVLVNEVMCVCCWCVQCMDVCVEDKGGTILETV